MNGKCLLLAWIQKFLLDKKYIESISMGYAALQLKIMKTSILLKYILVGCKMKQNLNDRLQFAISVCSIIQNKICSLIIVAFLEIHMGFRNLFSFPIYLYFTLPWGIVFWSTAWCSTFFLCYSVNELTILTVAEIVAKTLGFFIKVDFFYFFIFYTQNGWEHFLNLQYFPCPFFCACLFVLTQSHHLLALFLTNCNGLIPNMCCQWIVCWHIWQYYHLLQSLINFSVFILWKFNKQTSNLEKEMSARCVG